MASWSGRAASEPLDIGSRRQLLFDDRFVTQAKGIEFRVHPPRKTGDQIVTSEPGWPLGGYHSVLRYAGRYHLWYMAGKCVHYACSGDGIHWEKPALGLLTPEATAGTGGGANVVMGRGVGDVKDTVHGLMVFIDPIAPEAERFRLVANPEEYDSNVQVFSSPDGMHWKLTHRDVLYFRNREKPQLDSPNVIFWDERIQKYTAYFRVKLRTQRPAVRCVARAESPQLGGFPAAEDCPVVMRADKQHPGHYSPLRKVHISVLDTYTNGTVKYPWAEDAYFMFPTEYYHYDSHHQEFEKGFPVNAGALDTRFAASRDGIEWNRFDHRAFIPLGMKGEFDSRRVYAAYGLVPALNGRDLYLYYLGTSETHGWQRDDRNNKLLTAAGLAPTGPSVLSRVVLRRDGFVSVRAAYAGGEFTTPVLRFTGEQLVLNVDTSASGELRAELQNGEGVPVPGFTLSECAIVHTTNEISRVVRWKGKSEVSSLAGTPVRIRFVMRDVDLYAFQFVERGNI
jgi:hypothetical protein